MQITHVRLFSLSKKLIEDLTRYCKKNSQNPMLTIIPRYIIDTYYTKEEEKGHSIYNTSIEPPYGTKLLTVVHNDAPNDIRKALLFNIANTETTIIDPNNILSLHDGQENYFKIARSEELISRILYTRSGESEEHNNIAYMSYYTGYQELIIQVDQADIIEEKAPGVLLPNRYIFAAIESYDESSKEYVLVSSTQITNDKGEEILLSTDSYMLSSANKVIRVLLQGHNNDNDTLYPYALAFKEADLGILEITSKLGKSLNTKVNSKTLREFISNNGFTDNNEFIFSRENPIMHKLKETPII